MVSGFTVCPYVPYVDYGMSISDLEKALAESSSYWSCMGKTLGARNVYVDLDSSIKPHRNPTTGLYYFDGQFFYKKPLRHFATLTKEVKDE